MLSCKHVINIKIINDMFTIFVCTECLKDCVFTLTAYLRPDQPHFEPSTATLAGGYHIGQYRSEDCATQLSSPLRYFANNNFKLEKNKCCCPLKKIKCVQVYQQPKPCLCSQCLPSRNKTGHTHRIYYTLVSVLSVLFVLTHED